MPTRSVTADKMTIGAKGRGKHWTAAEVTARAEAQEAAVAVGKAAAALSELVKAHAGGSVPAAEVAAGIDGLGGASTKLLSVVGLLA